MAVLSLNKILAKQIQEFLGGSDAVLINTIWNLSSEVDEGMDRVTIPRISGLSAATITPGTRAAGGSMTTLGDVLLLDQAKEVSEYLGYQDNANSTVSLQDAFFMAAPRVYAEQFEELIQTQLGAAASGMDFNSGTLNSFSIANITEAKKKLDNQKVPKKDRYLAVNADGMAILASTSEFQDGSKSLSDEALKKGIVSMVKGFNVVQSEDVPSNKVHCYHRSAVAFAIQKGVESVIFDDKPYSQVYVALKGKYGCKQLDSGKRQVTITMAV